MDTKKVFEGQEYDYEYMLEMVKEYPKLKIAFENAKREVESIKDDLEEAEMELENIEIKWNNFNSEWKGFKPFEDALKSSQMSEGGSQ